MILQYPHIFEELKGRSKSRKQEKNQLLCTKMVGKIPWLVNLALYLNKNCIVKSTLCCITVKVYT